MLGDVCEVRAGIGFPKHLQGRTAGDVPFGKVRDISREWQQGNRYLRGADHYVTHDDVAQLRGKPLPAGTIVMAKIGEAVKLNRRAILAQSSLMDNNVMGWIPNQQFVRPEFLFYVSQTLRLEELTRATTVPSLRKGDVERLPVLMPPLAEQDAIVALLDTQLQRLTDGRKHFEDALAGLKRFRSSVLHDELERERWRRQPLNAVADIGSGLTKGRRTKGDVASYSFLRAANLRDGFLDLGEIKHIDATPVEAARTLLEVGDHLMVEGSGSPDRLGQGWLWEGQASQCLHQNHVFRARPRRGIVEPRFLAWALQSPSTRKYFRQCAKTTSGLATMNKKQLGALEVPVPPLDEQRAIAHRLDAAIHAAEQEVQSLRKQLRQADILRDALLHASCSGQLSRPPEVGVGGTSSRNTHAVLVVE